ncbi:MAG TPA: Fe-S cluster assembly protein SufD [Anaeromyxobacteraceae bacterium]|nr:Fe-S cluster assembly protein SufD [Anaeromyxobacteraceae bacterium]
MSEAEESLARMLADRPAPRTPLLRRLREDGQHAFLRVKLPTTSQEDWRFTSLAGLAARPLAFAAPAAVPADAELPPAPRLVFVNGRLDAARSDLSGLPPGVRAGSLAAALEERPAALEPHLGRIVPPPDHAFAALNAALLEDGAFLELSHGVRCERPIHLVFLTAAEGAALAAVAPRALVVAGAGARASVVEHHAGRGAYLSVPVTELALAEDAQLEHARVQEEGAAAYHVALLQVEQRARSRFTSQSIALGGAVARVEARARLAGEDATCDLHGLYVGQGQQVLDHFVHVDHAAPRATSRQLFKGILDGASRGVFAGRILVREGAQKTDAGQVNSNLLLSRDATIDAKPQLEILADDVKCSHGGTVGQIREDQLFYLRSRGVPAALARALLTWAFAAEMVEHVGPEEVRARVRRAVTARLPAGELLREVA